LKIPVLDLLLHPDFAAKLLHAKTLLQLYIRAYYIVKYKKTNVNDGVRVGINRHKFEKKSFR
jgi:hypothetical protein